MSANALAIISGTVIMIALYLLLTQKGQSGANPGDAAKKVIDTIGGIFTNSVTILSGRDIKQ